MTNSASARNVGQVLQAGVVYGGISLNDDERGAAGRQAAARPPHRTGRVPPRVEGFQRREIGFELAEALAPTSPVRLGVLSGLGGVGKTQLAADYAERAWAAGGVDVLVWITASRRDRVIADYARLAVDLTGVEDDSPEDGAGRLLDWLVTTTARWLVVLDDVRNPGDLTGLWPPHTPCGRVVVTTRRRDAALRRSGGCSLEVGLFSQRESVAYLAAKFARDRSLLVGADELARSLGFLPLALAQAAAYMADRQLTCAEYRSRLVDRRRTLASLLPDQAALPDQHDKTVAATWSLSVELADQLEPVGLAAPLLEVLALLDPNLIPFSLLTTRGVLAHLTEVTGLAVDVETARDALTCLHRLSLITYDPSSSSASVQIHALVQRAVRDRYTERRTTLPRVVANALLRAWPGVERDPAMGRALRANAMALWEAAGDRLWHEGCHGLLFRTGNSLGDSGQVTEAHRYYERLRAAVTARLGPNHPDSLTARYYLAYWQGESGDTVGAMAALEELLEDRLRILGAHHPSTLTTRHNIARRRGASGSSDQAVRDFERLVADRLRVLGPEHPHTLTSRHELAYWRGEAGDPTGAVASLEDLLVDRTRLFGPDHVETLTTRGNIAFWCGRAGDPAMAVRAFEELLADRLRVLGADHPHTFTTRHNIAYWRGEAGDPAGAVDALGGLLADRLRVLGIDHPHTLATRRALTWWKEVLD